MTEDDRATYTRSRSNMLLVGPDSRVDPLITAVTGMPAQAVPRWSVGHDDPDADASAVPETLLVRNVQLLTIEQQTRLFRTIGGWQGRVRVIATAPAPVYPLVARRQFHEGLYYRLNMVCLDQVPVIH